MQLRLAIDEQSTVVQQAQRQLGVSLDDSGLE
jgi:hypothetical protein